ncbi:MAG: hypothetical protein N2513_10115 [Deltaproteobacteria bacterium]|nr:hypothetical protein [Deltaproteobacteria bacterium]
MAVLNPILSLLEYKAKEIDSPYVISLLHTQRNESKAYAQKIRGILSLYPPSRLKKVNLVQISETLCEENDLPPAHAVLRSIAEEENFIIFNIAGGMNFQVASCLYLLPETKSFEILYPEQKGIHLFGIENGTLKYREKLPLPNALSVLDLQGVSHVQRNKKSKALQHVLETSKHVLPPGTFSVEIGNILFDYVWNSGNTLSFLKIFMDSLHRKSKRNLLNEARKILSFSETRSGSGELFHRLIFVLTDIPSLAERLKEESKGKIKVISDIREISEGDSVEKYETALSPEEMVYNTGNSGKNGILYLALGTDVLPTLIALWTHRPRKAVLFYTPFDQVIERYKNSLIKNAHLIPVEKISFVKTSIIGESILTYREVCEEKEPKFANVTSGTKAHAAFLSLFAKSNKFPICSIRTDDETVEEIPAGEKKELTGPDPVELLILRGMNVPPRGYGVGKDELLKDRDHYEGILTFIRMIPPSSSVRRLIRHGGEIPGARIEVFPEEQRIKIFLKQHNRVLEFSTQNNQWFENLIGYVMLLQGADAVRVRVLTDREKQASTLTEIDVVARFKSTYYAISCKAGDFEKNEASVEISATSKLFGRFTIPLIASLFYHDENPRRVNGVYMFGFRTFTYKDKMSALLRSARESARGKARERY